jgi:poly(3-hydroxyalkanoate) synthetase
LLPVLEPLLAVGHALPVDTLQWLFTLLDPFGVARKYGAFAKLDQDSARAELFVALEDWLNDGVPLAAPVARECLAGWYGANTPARGEWRVAGLPVDPSAIECPTLVATPARDRIVPPESARLLARLIPEATLLEPGAGHIGMVAGSGAETALWRPLQEWVRALPLPRERVRV